MSEVRFASFNASLNRNSEGELITDLSTADNEQASNVAEIIQRSNPDVLLINEFDFDADGRAAELFQQNYLSVSQNGADPIEYPFVYIAPSNTGVPSGLDFDNDGTTDGPGDAFGFGFFLGQFGMVLFSKYEIDTDNVRTFQEFLWKDMPGALLPDDPATSAPADWYSEEELDVFRLSSKNHWDVPINVNGEIVHVLASHPTPPVFDGPEDRNGTRNHDEIRFWSDYVTPGANGYIYDDAGNFGGLAEGERFVIMGDQNADPFDGDSTDNAILQILDNPLVNTDVTPASEGGLDASDRQGNNNLTQTGDPAFDTADFGEDIFGGPGNLRVDYVLPSSNTDIVDAGVFWPTEEDPLFRLTTDFPPSSSDHRLVFADADVGDLPEDLDRKSVTEVERLGDVVTFDTGTIFAETELGGISGLAYDEANGVYYALSDDRSQNAPARFYTASIDLSDGSLDAGDVAFLDVTTLTDTNGNPFPEGGIDPEGIALRNNGSLFISSEGNANELLAPFINGFSLAGKQFSELLVPDKFLPTADESSGIRNNQAFESLTLTPDGRFLYAATENALYQDGERSSLENQSLSRIIKYDVATRQPVGEFVYEVEPIPLPPKPAESFADNGLVELLALDNNGTLLALERSFAVGVGNTIKLFEIQTQGALDVGSVDSLFNEADGVPFEIDPAVSKRLLVDFADLGIDPDNVEAMSFGPQLEDGRRSVIFASDNNFNDAQTTQFFALGLDIASTPAAQPTVETPYTIDAEPKALDILLVNDDGFEAEGIEVMFDALVAAGHNVTLVAPKDQQSGIGTKLDVDSLFQPTEVVEFEPNKWFVDGTPVTTTLAALDFILEGEAPDLVISGINEGANIGESIAISSGTVSAATEATRSNIPAIAVSAETVGDEEGNQIEVYERGADFVIELVKQLETQRPSEGDILPEGVGLNVNIPATIDEIEGVAITQLDETSTFDIFVGDLGAVTGEDANGVPSLLATGNPPIVPEDITVPDSEGQNFLANFITVTPIDGDWTAGEATRQALSDRLEVIPEIPIDQPLDILLTNDDGFDAEGIETLYNALTVAGHNVTLVGPKEQQSGTGTALDVGQFFQPLDIQNVEENKWFVDASVRTTTWAGLDSILDEAPDLVISGINEGENIGPGGAVSSGTVSAAVTGLRRDVPAIAISGGIDLATFSTPTETFEAGADFLVDLIRDLQATQGDAPFILPEGIGLSINVPSRFPEGVDGIQGVKFTNSSDITPFEIDFGPVDAEGGAGLRFAPFELPADAEIDPLSEGGQFLSGFITVTPIDGNWTAADEAYAATEDLLAAPAPELRGDSDDPAIWVNPNDASQSIFYGTLKDGGLAAFDLEGNVVQTIAPDEFGAERYNNVDLVYGFEGLDLAGSFRTDLAVVSDRENDTLAIFQIDPATGQLTDVTAPALQEADFSIFGVDDGEATAYGLTTYTSPKSGRTFAFVTQADGNQVAQLELISRIGPADEFFVDAEVVRTLELPTPTGDPEDSQAEGLVVDRELGVLYVSLEEEVGLLKYSAEPDGGDDFTLVQSIDEDFLVPDIEGLSIYYGANGSGYLIANSQGDSSYAVFTREGTNEYLGSFVVGDNGDIDQVNESDGLDVINVPLGDAFPNGALFLQDGANDPQNPVPEDEELENNSTNFKIVPWESVANSFPLPLDINTSSFDPRNPQPQSLVNGVASGDVTQDSVVLWARSIFTGEVTFDYSTSETFDAIAGTTTTTVTDINQPVKVEIDGLDAGTEYFYRATDAAGDTETGRFVTSAEADTQAGLTFGISGDWQQAPPHPILSSTAESELDFFVKLGDTIFADSETPATPGVTQSRTLEQFRAKHSEVLSPRFDVSTTSDLYASTSILATIDDHEVVDNFAGGAAPGDSPDAPDIGSSPDPLFTDDVDFVNDTQAYEDALQAYQEYHPLRDEFYDTPDDDRTDGERKLYRANDYGSDASVFVLDSRSFRDDQLDPVDLVNPVPFIAETFDPNRTLLGKAQLEQLKDDLLDAQAGGTTWKFVVIPEPIQNFGVVGAEDRFEGYAAERAELLGFIDENGIDNVVFMAGDFHGTIVNNLTYQTAPGQEQIATSAFEVVTGPVAFFDGRFGPNVANISAAAGFIGPDELAFYESLPVAPDGDDIVNDKDDFIEQLLIGQTDLFGYDPVGLDNNLVQAEGLIDATLLQGDYLAAHNYSWTEFDINPDTQELIVTTFGIEAYSEEELLADPEAVIANSTPTIISQFAVNPSGLDPRTEGTNGRDRLIGTDADEVFASFGDNDAVRGFGGNDTIRTGDGNDQIFGDIPNTFGMGGNDFVDAGDGHDEVRGNSGNDTLLGGAGLDRIFGGEGDDFIRGGEGDDVLKGDSFRPELGNDTFVLAAGEGTDTIRDFQIGEDLIALADGLTFGDLSFSDVDGVAEIAFGDETLAILNRVSAGDLNADAFVAV
ncbi:MAG: 5'/3'-nucleotidase SurE [Cyanobacteria bacterium J06642_2]